MRKKLPKKRPKPVATTAGSVSPWLVDVPLDHMK